MNLAASPLDAARADSLVHAPPSRDANPFATCWTRPGAIPFLFPDGQSATRLVAKLSASGMHGAIVGPHGSGKSSLLEALKPALLSAGFSVHGITLRNHQRRLPTWFLKTLPERPGIAIVDGYEQLSWLSRVGLHHACRRAGLGLLVTAHQRTRYPTLIRLAPDERLVRKLAAHLAAKVSTPVTAADVVASHARHGRNVREILFELYDRHEELRRAGRTLALPEA